MSVTGRTCLAALALAVALVGTACTPAPDAGRIKGVDVTAPPVTLVPQKKDAETALSDPETYGLPSLAILQANPGGVAGGLLQRTAQTTWTEHWSVEIKGGHAGDVVLDHMPADPAKGTGEMLHVAGTLGTADGGTATFAILDKDGAVRACATGSSSNGAWVCDVGDMKVALQFLSIQGFQTLAELLRQLLAFPGLSVQYYMVGGAPSACFFFPPVPNLAPDGQKLGLDVSNGGSYCLSREGALDKLDFGDLKFVATEYSTSANPAKFTLPV